MCFKPISCWLKKHVAERACCRAEMLVQSCCRCTSNFFTHGLCLLRAAGCRVDVGPVAGLGAVCSVRVKPQVKEHVFVEGCYFFHSRVTFGLIKMKNFFSVDHGEGCCILQYKMQPCAPPFKCWAVVWTLSFLQLNHCVQVVNVELFIPRLAHGLPSKTCKDQLLEVIIIAVGCSNACVFTSSHAAGRKAFPIKNGM